jgi:hypothetical protein
MNCIYCKYFVLGGRYDPNKGLLHDASLNHGLCLNHKIKSDYVEGWEDRKTDGSVPDGGIYASCDEDRGILHVHKNFGCIQFEIK